MNKSRLTFTITFALLMLFSFQVNAQDFKSLDKSPLDAAAYPSSHKESEKSVKVIYSRPQLKERSLEKLVPNGKVWRTGANEASEITFYNDAVFGGKKVKAGTYALFTIPGEKEWTVILSTDINVWGSYAYNEANDVVRVMAPVTEGKKSLEAFSIAFDDAGTMFLGWDTLRVSVAITK
ncbi:DUF2911 domain-containing protein [Lacinutrix undariae]